MGEEGDGGRDIGSRISDQAGDVPEVRYWHRRRCRRESGARERAPDSRLCVCVRVTPGPRPPQGVGMRPSPPRRPARPATRRRPVSEASSPRDRRHAQSGRGASRAWTPRARRDAGHAQSGRGAARAGRASRLGSLRKAAGLRARDGFFVTGRPARLFVNRPPAHIRLFLPSPPRARR